MKLKICDTSPRIFAEWQVRNEDWNQINGVSSMVFANNSTTEVKEIQKNKIASISCDKQKIIPDELITYTVKLDEKEKDKVKTEIKQVKFCLWFEYKDKSDKKKKLEIDKKITPAGVILVRKRNAFSRVTDIFEPREDIGETLTRNLDSAYYYANITYTENEAKLEIKYSKWMDGYRIRVEAYFKKILQDGGNTTASRWVQANPEIIKGYWTNDKRENITNKTVGYKDTVYMCLKTLGMKDKTITTALWEEGITYWWDKNTDHELCMNENVEWKLTDRNSYKKLELPDENDKDYKKQREEITEGEQLELYFALPSEKQTKGYKQKFASKLKLTTKELLSNAYFAKQIKQEAIHDGTVQPEEEPPKKHIVKSGDNIYKLAKKYGIKDWKKFAKDNKVKPPNYWLTIGNTLNLPEEAVIPKDTATTQVQTTSQPKAQAETVYKRIDTATLGSEVWLVVETANLQGKKVSIELFDNEQLFEKDNETPIRFLKDDKEVTKVKDIPVNEEGIAKVKIKLRPKSDDDYKKLKEKFKDDKVAKLFLKVTCKGDEGKHEKEFLSGEKFEVSKNKRAPWMEVAIRQAKKAKGCKESEKPMYDMAKSYLRFVGNKFEPTDGNKGPWCAAFMNWCINESGYKYAKSASSLAPIHNLYKKNFKKIDKPIYGCIVVYKHTSKWKGHTGFLYGKTKDDKYILLGGNQDNTIKMDDYGEYTSKSKTKKLYGFYIPADYVVSEDDYLTEDDKNLSLEDSNTKIGVTSSKSSGQTN